MAQVDTTHTTLTMTGGGVPTVAPLPHPPVRFRFDTPRISAAGSVRLRGNPGESVAGWAIGFVQLKFIGTNYARYRGLSDRAGSVKVSGSNRILCRDTDETAPDEWYDPVKGGLFDDGRGTRVLAVGTVLPASGFLDVPAIFWDQPGRTWPSVQTNTMVPGRPNNFLYHADIGLAFCTILAARDPANHFHLLRHFYWNVRWEHMFNRTAAGAVVAGRLIHLELNIQQPSQSGVANDHRFRGKELDMTLPISNDVSRRPAHVHAARDWRLM